MRTVRGLRQKQVTDAFEVHEKKKELYERNCALTSVTAAATAAASSLPTVCCCNVFTQQFNPVERERERDRGR